MTEHANITSIDHILLAMPHGEEAKAIHFYSDILGLRQVAKPASLQENGGAWFSTLSSEGAALVHLGGEADFRSARKAHPAFAVDDIDTFAKQLEHHHLTLHWDERLLPQTRRFFVFDPFGNRLEFLQHQS